MGFILILLYILICGKLTHIDADPLDGERVEDAIVNEFPFIASLQKKVPYNDKGEQHICTGALINMKDVLTAAHCFVNIKVVDLQVILGVIDVDSNVTKYNVKWVITYDNWADTTNARKKFGTNDVAILRLSTSVSNIKPVILTGLKTLQLHRTKAVIVGWSHAPTTGRISRLRKANVNIYTLDGCRRQTYLISNLREIVQRNHLCTAADPFALLSCVSHYFSYAIIALEGDSGAPLLDKKNHLIGVSSGSCIRDSLRWGNFSENFTNKYEVNIHFSVDDYRNFIGFVTNIRQA